MGRIKDVHGFYLIYFFVISLDYFITVHLFSLFSIFLFFLCFAIWLRNHTTLSNYKTFINFSLLLQLVNKELYKKLFKKTNNKNCTAPHEQYLLSRFAKKNAKQTKVNSLGESLWVWVTLELHCKLIHSSFEDCTAIKIDKKHYDL